MLGSDNDELANSVEHDGGKVDIRKIRQRDMSEIRSFGEAICPDDSETAQSEP
jgi:hypothetical protein